MFKRRRIGEFLATLDRIPMPEQDLARLEESIRAEITSLWQTDEVRSRRPTVYDEVKMGLDYYDVSIFATLPGLYREISEALRASYGLEIEAHMLPQVLRFGSWIGGDRDGNPFVTPGVTRDAIQLARGHLLLYYQGQLDGIIDLLTTSAQQRAVSDELRQRLKAYVALVHTPEAQVFRAVRVRILPSLRNLRESSRAADPGADGPSLRRFHICTAGYPLHAKPGSGHAGAGVACRIALSMSFWMTWNRCAHRWLQMRVSASRER